MLNEEQAILRAAELAEKMATCPLCRQANEDGTPAEVCMSAIDPICNAVWTEIDADPTLGEAFSFITMFAELGVDLAVAVRDNPDAFTGATEGEAEDA